MKLLEAQIDGFGQLQGLQCRLDGKSAIIYGLNEAGKSTLMGFIRTMLYGFARRNGPPADRQEPVNGGNHGGRLMFSDESGDVYIVERYASVNGGKPKLIALQTVEGAGAGVERWLTQEEWERRFLNGTSESTYRQLYAITLTELQQVGALAGDELGRYLYDAGWESGKAVGQAEKRLQQEMESLFKPRGVNQQMNRQLKSLEGTEAELRKQADAISGYNTLKRQLEQLNEELEELDERLPLKLEKVRLLAKANGVRPQWLERLELTRERESLAATERITGEAEQRWLDLERERSGRQDGLEQYRRELELIESQRSGLQVDESLLARMDEADALMLESERMTLLKEERIELASELRGDEEAIGRLIARIAPDWTEEELRAVKLTVADREHVRGVKLQEMEHARQQERLQAERSHALEAERDAAHSLAEAEAMLAGAEQASQAGGAARGFIFVPQTSEALLMAWNDCETALQDWELERLQSDAAPGPEAAARSEAGLLLWAAAAAAAGAAVALAVLAPGNGAAVLGAAAAAAMLAALAWWRGRSTQGGRYGAAGEAAGPRQSGQRRGRGSGQSRYSDSGGSNSRDGAAAARDIGERSKRLVTGREAAALRLRPAAQRVNAALAALLQAPAEAAAALLAAPGTIGAGMAAAPEQALAARHAREQLRASVTARREALQRREQLQQSRLELGNRLQRLRAAAEERRAAVEEAARQREAAAGAWRGWLEALALPQAMSPDAALEVFELVEQALQRLAQRERRAAKYAAAGQQLAAFEAQAAELCASLPEAAKASPPLSLRLLQAELRRQEAARQEAARLDERLAELNLAIRDASARIDSANAETADLVKQAGMETAAEFAAALSLRLRLSSIDADLNRLTIELTAGLSEQRFTELDSLLQSHDEAELIELHAEAVESYDHSERMKAEKLDARGRMRQQLEQLLQEDEGRKLLADKEMTIAQLEQDGERYAVLAVSASLIRATKRIYEEERQPEVLRLASEYVRELTEGRYIRVMTTPGDPAIRLETADKRFVPTDRLSRGTAEQVYLAMRLALAEEAAHRQRLPMLLDDLFVNFDRPRLLAAAGLVRRLAQSRQMLLFTCHDHIRDLLTGLMPQAAFIQLEG